MSFKESFNDFKKRRYAIPVAIALTVLLTLAIVLYLSSLCFSFMLVALIAYGIPYYCGLKNRKKLFVFGTVLILFLGVVFGLNIFYYVQGYNGQVIHSEQNDLFSGQVSPVKGLPADTYEFTVEVLNGNNQSVVYLLAVNGASTSTLNYSMTFTGMDGANAIYSKTLSNLTEGIYQFQFQGLVGNTYVLTDVALGPIAMSMDAVLSSYLFYGIIYVGILQIGILFYLLLVLTWWMDRSKAKMADFDRARKQEKKGDDGQKVVDKFICSECGADVPSDANECPRCGEKFEAAVERECHFCKAKVLESDVKCWNCGKELPKK
jgi:DNA-directed RNA polymerase subunit RPC12/RpoP